MRAASGQTCKACSVHIGGRESAWPKVLADHFMASANALKNIRKNIGIILSRVETGALKPHRIYVWMEAKSCCTWLHESHCQRCWVQDYSKASQGRPSYTSACKQKCCIAFQYCINVVLHWAKLSRVELHKCWIALSQAPDQLTFHPFSCTIG